MRARICTMAPLRLPPRQQYTSGFQSCAWPRKCCDMTRDIGGDQRRPQLLCLERAGLLVQGAHAHAFLVIEHGQVDGARQMVFGKFGRAAYIDDGIEGAQARQDLAKRQDGWIFHCGKVDRTWTPIIPDKRRWRAPVTLLPENC